ncbi:MAG: PfkB family carbohydrate kinase [Cyanobacteria bacterium]|nr:PfkB family carbohydrate kinase [Cyanobacteriota bacterium]
MAKQGLFLGLVTVNVMYQTPIPLGSNEKRQADGMCLAAGGPATNAAIAFQGLGSQSRLLGAIGCHPLSSVIRDDLTHHGVTWSDLTPHEPLPPPMSSIITSTTTGDRAVITRNAMGRRSPGMDILAGTLQGVSILMVDGHQMQLSAEAARQVQQCQRPVVVDAGSWKPHFDRVLRQATVVIASQQFRPPGCDTVEAAIAYLIALGIPQVAVTRGPEPILYHTPHGAGTVPVPPVQARDTLGAGDIFHGAFCHYYPEHDFQTALAKAAMIAATACESIWTRAWLSALRYRAK